MPNNFVGELPNGRWRVGEDDFQELRLAVNICRRRNGGGIVEVWGVGWAYMEKWAPGQDQPMPYEYAYDRVGMVWRRVG